MEIQYSSIKKMSDICAACSFETAIVKQDQKWIVILQLGLRNTDLR